jgi:hypothetical protein
MLRQRSFLVVLASICVASRTLFNVARSFSRVYRIYQAIDEVNATDPRDDPQELVYGKRMTETLEKYDPSASDVVKIACRGQHIARWLIRRSEFPEGKHGYLRWRKQLYAMHAKMMRELLENDGGFSKQEIDKVCCLVGKEWDLKNDLEAAAVEDVAALLFLEHSFPPFTDKINERDKMVCIVEKTWQKMSPKAHQIALSMSMEKAQIEIVQRALNKASTRPMSEDF